MSGILGRSNTSVDAASNLVDVIPDTIDLHIEFMDGFGWTGFDRLIQNEPSQIGAFGQAALLCFLAQRFVFMMAEYEVRVAGVIFFQISFLRSFFKNPPGGGIGVRGMPRQAAKMYIFAMLARTAPMGAAVRPAGGPLFWMWKKPSRSCLYGFQKEKWWAGKDKNQGFR